MRQQEMDGGRAAPREGGRARAEERGRPAAAGPAREPPGPPARGDPALEERGRARPDRPARRPTRWPSTSSARAATESLAEAQRVLESLARADGQPGRAPGVGAPGRQARRCGRAAARRSRRSPRRRSPGRRRRGSSSRELQKAAADPAAAATRVAFLKNVLLRAPEFRSALAAGEHAPQRGRRAARPASSPCATRSRGRGAPDEALAFEVQAARRARRGRRGDAAVADRRRARRSWPSAGARRGAPARAA